MKQKIEWYQEVLELEPGSRVFFPLAKLLAEDGQTAEAIHTLRQGALHHPEHIEARLLLVELLAAQGSDMQVEVEKLGALLAAYPGFWNAWEEQLARSSSTRDAALALRFFVAVLQGASLDWAAVIEQGLRNTLTGASAALAAARAAVVASPDDARESGTPAASAPLVESDASATRAASAERDPAATQSPEGRSLTDEYKPTFVPQPLLAVDPADEDENDEVFSLRTRSMAEVLAEQGDTAGALDIYNELWQDAPAEEKPGLRARADELAGRIQQAPPVVTTSEEKPPVSDEESGRLVNLLESLAQRLEARAQ